MKDDDLNPPWWVACIFVALLPVIGWGLLYCVVMIVSILRESGIPNPMALAACHWGDTYWCDKI